MRKPPQKSGSGTDTLGTVYFDRLFPMGVEAMLESVDLVKAGKARYIGASSMFAWQFAKAQHVAATNGWARFVSMQNHWNLLYREEEREMQGLCLDQGVGDLEPGDRVWVWDGCLAWQDSKGLTMPEAVSLS